MSSTPVAGDGPSLRTVSAYVAQPPAGTSAGPVLATDRSATGVTSTGEDAVLSAGSISVLSVVETSASLSCVPTASPVATTVTSVASVSSIRPRSHVITWPATAQVPWSGLAET